MQNWIGFLLIKILNLTPECAVFNETRVSLIILTGVGVTKPDREVRKEKRSRDDPREEGECVKTRAYVTKNLELHLTLSRR